jgi:hypothetical protein
MSESRKGQGGQALIPVLVATLGALLLATAMLGFAMRDIPLGKHDQDWNGALSAAEAGIDDYLYRINRNTNYWTYNNTLNGQSVNLPPAATDPNPAFTGHTPVSGGATDSSYRYDVKSDPNATQGVKINVTGKVGKSKRTIEAVIRRRSFLDYLWFTDYETKDPLSYDNTDSLTVLQAAGNGTTVPGVCTRHQWETPTRSSSCTDINFLSIDTVSGPVHTNDTLLICGTPNFLGPTVTTGLVTPISGKMWNGNATCTNNPSFPTGYPKNATGIVMPPSNFALREQVNITLGGTGCLYTGPTKITLNSSGTMDVVSPFSVGTNPVTGAARNRNGCGVGLNQPLPSNGVIVVQNVPATSSDPNYTNACVGGFYPAGLTPAATPPARVDVTPYGCSNGDAFVSGTLKGQLTIAADNNIDIVGNLVNFDTTPGSTDILGLIANNYVEIYHPVQCTANCGNVATATYANLPGSLTNPVVHAAILSVAHSFRAQNPGRGSAQSTNGTITIKGSIAQKYRGLVTQNSKGYGKNYSYDSRLKVLSPPYFLDPIQSAWQVQKWGEIKAPTGW